MKKERVVILSLVFFAIAMLFARLPALQNRSVGSNESTTLLTLAGQAAPLYPTEIMSPTDAAEHLFSPLTNFRTIVTELETADGHPPTYYWLLLSWDRAVGEGLANSRLLSAVLGSIFLLLIGLALRKQMPLPELLLLELMVGLSSTLSYFATEARSYMLCLVLVLIAFILSLRTTRKLQVGAPALSAMVGVALATGLGIFTNYFIVLIALAIGLWLLFEARHLRLPQIVKLAIAFALPNIVFCLASRHFYEMQHAVHASNRNGYKGFSADLVNYGKHFLRPFVNRVDAGYIFFLSIFLLFVFVVALSQKKSREQKSILTFSLLSVGLITGGLFIINVMMNKFMYPFRYFVLAVPGLFLLTAVALGAQKSRALRLVLNGFLLIVIGLEGYNFNWQGTEIAEIDYSKSQTRTATNSVLELSRYDQKVLVLVERTPERDWPAGIVLDLAKKANSPSAEAGQELDVLVLPPNETAASYLSKNPGLAEYTKIWFMAADDISLPARLLYEENQPAEFTLAAKHDWGFLLTPKVAAQGSEEQ